MEFKKAKAHIRYTLRDGTRVPGTTTITGQLNKPALVKWANKMGLQGIDSTKYRDAAANVGTLAHYMVECELAGQEADLADYSPNEVDKAKKALVKWHDYRKQHKLEPILLEEPMVSETYRYGGTIDYFGGRDSISALIDFKTGKDIYPEHLYQAAAYRQLLIEAGYDVDDGYILRIGRDETEGFEEKQIKNWDALWNVFWLLRQLYDALKEAKK